jgi:hypothetical protein
MSLSNVDDEQEVRRLFNLMIESSCEAGKPNLEHYMHDDFTGTYSNYEADRRGFTDKEMLVTKWGSQNDQTMPGASASADIQRILVSGDTAVVFALITDKIPGPDGERILKSWVSDVWVKREDKWKWLSSYESLVK